MENGKQGEPIAFPVRPPPVMAGRHEELRRSVILGPDDVRHALFSPRRMARTSLFAKPDDYETTAGVTSAGAPRRDCDSVGPEPGLDLGGLERPAAVSPAPKAPAIQPVDAKRLSLLKRIARYFDL